MMEQEMFKGLEVVQRNEYSHGLQNLAGEGVKREWTMKQNYLSRRFTTNWNEILEIE